MQRTRTQQRVTRPRDDVHQALPLDPRDLDVLRAKRRRARNAVALVARTVR